MFVKEMEDFKVMSTSPTLNNTNNLSIKHDKPSQGTDNFHRKVSVESECSNKEDRCLAEPIYLHLTDAIDASIDIQENLNAWKHNKTHNTRNTTDVAQSSTSQSNTVQLLGHSSLKYKNPYSVSISSLTHHKKLNHTSEDEPQEGRKDQNVLHDCREYFVNYQDCNTSSTEYSFAALIIVMAQATTRSLWGLLQMILNVASVIQMFSFILRFVLEKVINIRRTKDCHQAMVKFIIFTIQLLSIYVCLVFIFGFIILPIIQMTAGIVAKLI